MLEKTKTAFVVLEDVPHDIYAALLVALGSVLTFLGHHDEAMLVLGAGIGIFKGSK